MLAMILPGTDNKENSVSWDDFSVPNLITQFCHCCLITCIYYFCLYAINSGCFTILEISDCLPHLIKGYWYCVNV